MRLNFIRQRNILISDARYKVLSKFKIDVDTLTLENFVLSSIKFLQKCDFIDGSRLVLNFDRIDKKETHDVFFFKTHKIRFSSGILYKFF